MLRFAFVNEGADREYRSLPDDIQDEFGKELRRLQYGEKPNVPIEYLRESVGHGVVELKINGSPAYRCIYVAKYENTIIVLHSFRKTTNRVDKPALELAKSRLKDFLASIK